MRASRIEAASVALIALLLVGMGMATGGPVGQDPAYHRFADARTWWGVPNTLDVLSNVFFAAAGLWGLSLGARCEAGLRSSLDLFFTGLVLTAAGSAYYHWAPSDATLVWDRLPIVISFAGAIGAMAHQYLGADARARWANAWLCMGVLSVGLWAAGGDLRLYLVVQFGGFLLGLSWILGHRFAATAAPAGSTSLPWGGVWGAYALAKLAESLDAWLWHWTSGALAGHALKHVIAAAGVALLCRALSRQASR
jgi:hypothetical protein